MAAGADGHEEVAALQGLVDLVHGHGELVEPDDVGTHAPGSAGGAYAVAIHVTRPVQDGSAARAAGFQQLAVHVDEAAGAGPVVEVVHVLGHQQELARPGALELDEGVVRGIGLVGGEAPPPLVVEAVDQLRIPPEGLRGGNVLQAVALPQPVPIPEGAHAALRRDAGASQEHQPGIAGEGRVGGTHGLGEAGFPVGGVPRSRARPSTGPGLRPSSRARVGARSTMRTGSRRSPAFQGPQKISGTRRS